MQTITSARKISREEYIAALNDLFARYGMGITVTANDFLFLDEVVTDDINGDRQLTVALTSAISPAIHSGEFYHYTKRETATAILNSQRLRMTSVEKRIEEDEIEGFLWKFGFTHPLTLDFDTKEPRYKTSLAREIFYTSFTDTSLRPDEEQYFWDTFAGADGARLKFKIELKSGCLRRMVYGDDIEKWAQFFREVTEITQKMLGKIFFWGDSATVCALHLPDSYDVEKETRLITRRSCGLCLGNDAGSEYLELKFGSNDPIKVDLQLLEIQTDQPVENTSGAIVSPRT